MAADIVPDLYEKIHSDFEQRIKANKWIQSFLGRLKKKTATPKEASLYAAELGDCAAFALTRNLTEENLPGGKLYWNIADRTIKPLLQEVHKLVMDAAVEVQLIEDEKTGINLKPIRSPFPEYRVNDLINKLISILEEETDE